MRKRSYLWWNVAGIVVFGAGFLVGSIAVATQGGMSGASGVMTIAAVLQVVGGGTAVVAFALEMRRRLRVKRQQRRLGVS